MAPKPLKTSVVGISTLILSTVLQTWLEIVEKIVSRYCFVKNKRQEEEPGQGRGRKRKAWLNLAFLGASWYFLFANDVATPVSWRERSSGLENAELNLL